MRFLAHVFLHVFVTELLSFMYSVCPQISFLLCFSNKIKKVVEGEKRTLVPHALVYRARDMTYVFILVCPKKYTLDQFQFHVEKLHISNRKTSVTGTNIYVKPRYCVYFCLPVAKKYYCRWEVLYLYKQQQPAGATNSTSDTRK